MNLNTLKTIQTFSARALNQTITLGSAYNRNNKAAQNQIVSENILRKATQLVNDLLALRKSKTGTDETQQAVTPISKSVQDILDLREKLGVDDAHAPAEKVLTQILDPKRGSLFDGKS
jgi:hypothetical protein